MEITNGSYGKYLKIVRGNSIRKNKLSLVLLFPCHDRDVTHACYVIRAARYTVSWLYFRKRHAFFFVACYIIVPFGYYI